MNERRAKCTAAAASAAVVEAIHFQNFMRFVKCVGLGIAKHSHMILWKKFREKRIFGSQFSKRLHSQRKQQSFHILKLF